MVYVKKCPGVYGRNLPTTEFNKGGRTQIYCLGWIDQMTDEPLEVCKNCKDFVVGEQFEHDVDHKND